VSGVPSRVRGRVADEALTVEAGPAPAELKQPEPDKPVVVIAFGLLTAVSLAGAGVLGLTTVATLAGLVVAVVGVLVMEHRRRSLRRARERGVERPSAYGRLVLAVLVLSLGLAAAPAVLIRVAGLALEVEGHRLWPLRGMVLALACIFAVIHVSALIDWAVIRLRLRGVLGDWSMPCQRSPTTNWELLTRVWLLHRVAAHVVVRIGLAVFIGFCVALVVPARSGATTPANTVTDQVLSRPVLLLVAPVLAAILVFFLNRFLPVWALVLNPRLSVGDRIVLAEEYGTGVTKQPVYYVVDIAAEGVKLLQLDDGGHPKGAAGRDPEREHDRSINLVDIPRLLRFRGRFNGCRRVCCKANHHCPLRVGMTVSRALEADEATSLG
jgi:hypothetical protein